MVFPKSQKNVNLWIDSSDFKLIGKNSTSTKDVSWSYKENSPDQRYMFVQDAQTRFRVVIGGYSPKIDDNSFLELQKDILSKAIKSGTVSGDCGFNYGKKIFKEIQFLTPFSKPVGRPKKGGGDKELRMLTKPQEKWNKEVRLVRA